MQVSFNPLEPREAAAVRILLGIPLDVPPASLTLLDGSTPSPLGAPLLAATADGVLSTGPAAVLVPAAPAAPKAHKKRAAAAPAPEAPGVAVPSATLSIGDMLANSTQPATLSTGAALPTVAENVLVAPHIPATPAPLVSPTAAAQAAAQPAPTPAGGKPLTVEDVRAAYRDLFAVVGEEPGKAELRAVLAKAGAATVSDLKPDAYAATVRSLNAATIQAKSKTAPPAAAPANKDPLL